MPFVIARPAPVSAPWLVERVNRLEEKIGGAATNLGAGLLVSVQLLQMTWPGIQRSIWLMSDGVANRDVGVITQAVQQAQAHSISVNCMAVGDLAGAALLRQIAASTHNGRFVPVHTLHDFEQALRGVPSGTANGHCRREAIVVCVDVSKSMRGLLNGQRKIDLVKAALLDLIEWRCCTCV